VYIDGEKRMTLRGEAIADEFMQIVQTYIEQRFGQT
jgi:(E)-4-hydroxy-3-methylbut-2-enyl-diphosphate synthase